MNRENVIDHLNSFLRGEISAVETYRQAMDKVKDASALVTLQECQSSHESRVATLKDAIRRIGGTPASSSGAWGSFARLVESSAAAFGEASAIAALEEGEDHGLRDYKADLVDLEAEARRLIEQDILPEQQRTHSAVSKLKMAV